MRKTLYSSYKRYHSPYSQNFKVIKYYFVELFKRVFYFVLLMVSIVMMNYSMKETKIESYIRENIITLFKPIYFVAEAPFNLLYDFASGIKNILAINIVNKKLMEENLTLKKLYFESKYLKSENAILKEMLNYKDENADSYEYITSKIYYVPRNIMNDEIILNVGSHHNVLEGNIVLGPNKSVIGRIVNVNKKYSNLLLLTDINSKIHARLENGKDMIILSGQNDKYLQISYIFSNTVNFKEGDYVFTSGDSNLLPDGLVIGKIKKIKDTYVVELEEDLSRISYVIITIKK